MEKKNRCLAPCYCHSSNRRDFLKDTVFLTVGATLMGKLAFSFNNKEIKVPVIKACGPASDFVPQVKVAFVRRKEDYGILWPGAIYDGEAAREKYTGQLMETAKSLNVKLGLKQTPIYSLEEAETWLNEVRTEGADGLMLVLLDRQKHSWPTAQKAAETGIPLVVFSPLGTSFTTNTEGLAEKEGCVIYSTNDFRQAAYGMRMLKAKAKMNRASCIVIKGGQKGEKKVGRYRHLIAILTCQCIY